MNGKKHSQFTGIMLELKPGKRIAQARRSRERPEGHYSIVTFALSILMPCGLHE